MTRQEDRTARGSAIRESAKGLWTWRVFTVPLVLIVAVLVGGYFSLIARSVSVAEQQAIEHDLAGRHVYTVNLNSGLIESQVCERLRNFDGVITSFALSDEYRPHVLGNGVHVSVAEVSPGFVDYVDASALLDASLEANILVGADIAERAGLLSGADVLLTAGGHMEADAVIGLPRQVVVVPQTVRTGLSDDLVVAVNADRFLARNCIVESRADAALAVAEGVRALVPGAAAAVGPLEVTLEGDYGPEANMKSAIGGPVVWMAGALLALIPLALWYVRRAEWALFFAFGVNMRWQTTTVISEWFLLVAVPAFTGTAWAIIFLPASTTWLGHQIAVLNVGAILLLSVVAIPTWCAYLRFSSVLQALKD